VGGGGGGGGGFFRKKNSRKFPVMRETNGPPEKHVILLPKFRTITLIGLRDQQHGEESKNHSKKKKTKREEKEIIRIWRKEETINEAESNKENKFTFCVSMRER